MYKLEYPLNEKFPKLTKKYRIIKIIIKQYKKNPINTEDGVKIDFDDEWVHLRKSNTAPIIRIYTEGKTETTAVNIGNKIMGDIKELINENQLI